MLSSTLFTGVGQAVVVHAATAALMIIPVFVHAYAAIWTKGTCRRLNRPGFRGGSPV